MKAQEFCKIAVERFRLLCRLFNLKIPEKGGFMVVFEGPEVRLRVGYDAFRSQEVAASVELKTNLPEGCIYGYCLRDILKASGHYALPEARDDIIATEDAEVGCGDLVSINRATPVPV